MKVRFTKAAVAELDAIGKWIAEDDAERAATFVEEIRERCVSLREHPRRFPIVRRVPRGEFRKMSHKGYLIFYRVLDDVVEVGHVLHGARNWADILDSAS